MSSRPQKVSKLTQNISLAGNKTLLNPTTKPVKLTTKSVKITTKYVKLTTKSVKLATKSINLTTQFVNLTTPFLPPLFFNNSKSVTEEIFKYYNYFMVNFSKNQEYEIMAPNFDYGCLGYFYSYNYSHFGLLL